jgi:hypothetical protein
MVCDDEQNLVQGTLNPIIDYNNNFKLNALLSTNLISTNLNI